MAHFLSQAFRSLNERLKAEKRADYAYAYHDLRDEVNAQKYGDESKKDGSGGNVSSIDGLSVANGFAFRPRQHDFFGERTDRIKRTFPSRTLHDSPTFRHRTARTASHRRHASAPHQQSANDGDARRNAERTRRSRQLSRLHTFRRSAPFRARRSKRRFDQYLKTNPVAKAENSASASA